MSQVFYRDGLFAQEMFHRIYPSQNDKNVLSLDAIQTKDGSYIALHIELEEQENPQDTLYGDTLIITSFKLKGDVNWSKSIALTGKYKSFNPQLSSLIQGKNDSIYFSVVAFEDNLPVNLLGSFNINGNVGFLNASGTSATAADNTGESNLLLNYNRALFNAYGAVAANEQSIHLSKKDYNGNISWVKSLGTTVNNKNVPESLLGFEFADDNTFIMTGILDSIGSKPFITVLDTLGNPLMSKAYTDSGFLGSVPLSYNAHKFSDGTYVLTGYLLEIVSAFEFAIKGFIIKTNAIGNVTWSKKLEVNRGDFTLLKHSLVDRDNNIVIAGSNFSFANQEAYPFMAKIDKSGKVLWKKKYDRTDSSFDFTGSLFQTRDQGYVYYTSASKDGLFVPSFIKTDKDGATGCESDIIENLIIDNNFAAEPLLWNVVNISNVTEDIETKIISHNFNIPNLTLIPKSFCPNEQIDYVLDASTPGATSYKWNDNSTAPTLNVDRQGEYMVTVTFGNDGCFILTDTAEINTLHPDYDALMEFYDSTNGAQWTNNTGWKEGKEGTSCDPCNFNGRPWFGIQCKDGRIETIVLSNNNLIGILPNVNIPNLKLFEISSNHLSGSIPNFNLPNLQGLHLSNNKLNGNIPEFNLPNLVSLDLSYNLINSVLPNFNLPNLWTLQLQRNKITGLLPEFNLPKLKVLNLSYNQINGAISDFNFPELLSLFLSSNNLNGEIPSFNLPNLEALYLDKNLFNSSIPLFNLPYLIVMDLSNNQIEGPIPNFNCPNLGIVNIENNMISGCIPSYFVKFCDSIIIENPKGKFKKFKPNINLLKNPLLPWQGDFTQFCATNGSQQAQIGAPCNNSNSTDGENDVIQADCGCGNIDCPDAKIYLNDISDCNFGGKIPLTFTIIDTLPSGDLGITWSSPNANTRAAIDTVSNPPLFDTQIAGAGNHLIILTIKQGNCTWTDSILIQLKVIPSSDFTVGPGGCLADPVKVTYSGGTTGAVYTWNFGPDVIGTYSGPGPHSVLWTNPGQKTITLSVSKDGCVSTVTTRTISLSPLLDAPTITCLEAKVDGVTFSWTSIPNTSRYDIVVEIVGGAVLFSGTTTEPSYEVPGLTEGTQVRITVAAMSTNGCPNTTATLICKAQSCPDARLSIPERQITACLTPDIAPIPLTFSIANNISNETPTITWFSSSPKTNAAIKNSTNPPVFVPLEAGAGTHFIELKYEQKGCIWTDSMVIKLNMPDEVVLKNDTVYVQAGTPVTLNVSDNDILPPEPYTIKAKEISSETVNLVSFDNQGNATLQVTGELNEDERITYEVCDDCNQCYEGILVIINEDFKNFIPVTLFTPDASSNKTLQFTKLPVKDSKLWIYNRWGQEIYYKEGYENDWNADGYPGGVYYYVLEIYGVKIKKALTVVK